MTTLLVTWHVADVLIAQELITNKFLENQPFVLSPCRVVEVFVEDDDSAGKDQAAQASENLLRRGVQITVHMHKRDGLLIFGCEAAKGFAEQARMQFDVRPDGWNPLREMAFLESGMPIFGQSFETVKTRPLRRGAAFHRALDPCRLPAYSVDLILRNN